jgi:hypothetical protein
MVVPKLQASSLKLQVKSWPAVVYRLQLATYSSKKDNRHRFKKRSSPLVTVFPPPVRGALQQVRPVRLGWGVV